MIKFSFMRRIQIIIVLMISFLIFIKTESALAISPPGLLIPSNGSNRPGYTVMFAWSPSSGAISYYFEVSDLPFSNWYDQTIAVVYLNGFFHDNGNTYHWRMKAKDYNGIESNFSDTWSFVNGPTPPSPPDVPTLISPANNSNDPSPTIEFRWNPVPRADSCYIEIATDIGFTSIYNYGWVGGTYTGANVDGFLNIGQTFYWHVKAKNSIGESSFLLHGI